MQELTEAQQERYQNISNEVGRIRGRLGYLWGAKPGLLAIGYAWADLEGAALQLRKILEHFAFCSLVLNPDVYERTKTAVEEVVDAAEILNTLKKTHEFYFPMAIRFVDDEIVGGTRIVYPSEDVLTEQNFIEFYNLLSKRLLHVRNPLKPDLPIIEWACQFNRIVTCITGTLAQFAIHVYGDNTLVVVNVPRDGQMTLHTMVKTRLNPG
jgi:hypothetical protein